MNAEIITIGDEILIGQITDTNATFISKQLDNIGVSVVRISSIPDTAQAIHQAIAEGEKRADLILITGGLGPTKDDVTKTVFCNYFQDELVHNSEVFTHIEHLFEKYIGRKVTPINKLQAMVPSRAIVLKNKFGTAPGMWMEHNEKIFIAMPGVPMEMKSLMNFEIIPKLLKKFDLPYIVHHTLITYGIGESTVAERLDAWEDDLPAHIKIAYLPNFGKLRLRLTARGPYDQKDRLDEEIERYKLELRSHIEEFFIGYENEGGLIKTIADLMQKKNATLSVAESCTGGALSKEITSLPGASNYFKGSTVCYTEDIKTRILGIADNLIAKYSVVSGEIAEALAISIRNKYQSDYGIGITGNAGPTVDKNTKTNVGEVFISVAGPDEVLTQGFSFGKPRQKVIDNSVLKALDLLRSMLSKQEINEAK